MKRTRFTVALLLLSLLVVALTAASCGGTDDTTTTAAPGATNGTGTTAGGGNAVPFKFGAAGSMTGQYASYGTALKAGADVAVDELNAAGGVNGGQASYEPGDDLGDPKEAVLVAQKFIDDSGILFVDGHMFSGATLAAGPKYEAAGLPMVSPSATNPDITNLGDFIWRIVMTDAAQGMGLADYAIKDLGKKKIAIIHDDNDYGKGLADAFEAQVKTAGGEVVDREQYTSGDTDFRAQLTKIKGAAPDLLFLSGYHPEGSKIAQQAKELGLDVQMLGSDGFASDELIKLAGASVEGMLISTFFDYSKQDEAVQKFVTAFKAKNNGANPDYFSACSYDVIMMVAEAAKKAGTNDRAAINDALGQLGTYTGISGDITFDENGDVQKPLNIVEVKDGAMVTAATQPSTTE